MFSLITTLHQPSDQNRWKEFIFCLQKNISNPVINEVVVVVDIDFNTKLLQDIENISVIIHSSNTSRPTFKDMLTYSDEVTRNDNKPRNWILANADIYFPEWNSHKLDELSSLDYSKNCVSLTRYNKFDNYTQKQKNTYNGYKFKYNNIDYITMHGGNLEGVSTDSWFYSTPLNFPIYTDHVTGNYGTVYNDATQSYDGYVNLNCNLDIEIGRPGCDQMVNYELSKVKTMLNPCLSVVSIHEHAGWSESSTTYTNICYKGKNYSREEYHDMMMWEREFRWKSVPYS